jgi:hypothetical protein
MCPSKHVRWPGRHDGSQDLCELAGAVRLFLSTLFLATTLAAFSTATALAFVTTALTALILVLVVWHEYLLSPLLQANQPPDPVQVPLSV